MELITVSLLVILVSVFTFYIGRLVVERIRFVKSVEHIPRMKNAYPIIGNLMAIMGPHNQLTSNVSDLLNRSPPMSLAWFGPIPSVILIRPEHVEAILGSVKYIDKPFPYKFLEPWLGTGLLTSTGSKWHSHRKMLTPTFHFRILETFLEVFTEKSEILVQKLKKNVGSKDFDIYPYITKCALDVICETAMGIEINAQSQEVYSEYVKAVFDISELVVDRILYPWLYPQFIFRWTKEGRHMKKCTDILHNFTNTVIRDRKNMRLPLGSPESSDEDRLIGIKKRKAFLDLLLDMAEKESSLTDEEIREEVDTFMFEGHDTTTAAICWTLQLLGSHPDVQDKVYKELEDIFQGSERSATMKDLNEMKYLDRVIKESLRLYPSVPFIARELKEPVEIDGYTLPPGLKIFVAIYFTHRCEEYFPNPEKFNPDNFLPEVIAKRHPYAYIPFSAGPRNCIGQKFASLEEKTLLSSILRNYEIRSVNKDLVAIPDLILRPENGIRVYITRRESKTPVKNTS